LTFRFDTIGLIREAKAAAFSYEFAVREGGAFVRANHAFAGVEHRLTEQERLAKIPVCLGRVLIVCRAIQLQFGIDV
jgi:hypothetical protein